MTGTVSPSRWIACACGRVCHSHAGFANHAATCTAEQARVAEYIRRIEEGE